MQPPDELGPQHEDDAKGDAAGADDRAPDVEAAAAPPAPSIVEPQPSAGRERLVSLDAFRGFAILGMLLVNEKVFGPATPVQLKHAHWHEMPHFADMVFPWFLLIVGIAIPYAAASRLQRGITWPAYFLDVLRRSVILIALGCLIASGYARYPICRMGVLQLIGLAYFVGALLYRLPLAPRLGVAAVFLVGHWAVVRFVPIPGVGAGVFTYDQNLIHYINDTYLGDYLAGIVGVVPTSALVLIGTAFGDTLRRARQRSMREVAILTGSGAALVIAGLIWSIDLRFSKPFWTASFILFAAGWGALTLGVFYFLIDVRRWRAWAFPLVVAGMNAIFIYVVPILVKIHTIKEWTWPPHGGHHTVEAAMRLYLFAHLGRVPGGYVYTLGYIFFWWLVVLWMYRKRLFWRV
jgi:predicted acyltransferase